MNSCAIGQAALFALLLSVPAVAQVAPTTPAASFSFRADNVPIKQALAMFARANQLTIVPDLDVDGSVTVEFQDLPLDTAMNALLEANGYYFSREGGLIRVRSQETRIFQIDYIRATRAGQGTNAVQISSGGSGGASASTQGTTMTVTNTSMVNFWGDLADQLKTMVSSTGNFTINSLAGTVFVRDRHRNIQSIAQFLTTVTANILRQIDLEVEIYEVTLNKSNQLGINWQYVANNLSVNTIPGQLGVGSAGGLIVQNPVYGAPPGAPALDIQYKQNHFQGVIQALAQQGNLKVISRPRLRTLNNQPAVVRVGQDLPIFITQVTQSPGSPPVITTNETVQTITVGTVLSITPQVSDGGLVTLDITPAVSRLVSTQTSPSGQTSAPVIDIREASSLVRLRDGATVVMGGLVQDYTTTTRNSIPLLGDIPLLGKLFSGVYTNMQRTELVFFLTPRVVPDLPSETSALAHPAP